MHLRTMHIPKRGLAYKTGIALLFCLCLVLSCTVAFGVYLAMQEAPGLEQRLIPLTSAEAFPKGPLLPGTRFDAFLLEKSKRLLTAYEKGNPVRCYKVALGGTPSGAKEVQGDEKTPEGLYTVDAKNPNSAYYKNVNISYPNTADRQRAAALGKSPGGDIKIHGLAPDFAHIGEMHLLYDWTNGCVAVTNDEMEEIYTRTVLPSPITIVP